MLASESPKYVTKSETRQVPPARVYVDTRLGDRDLWRPVLVLSVAHLLRDVHGKRF
jgi:hypothetical protein